VDNLLMAQLENFRLKVFRTVGEHLSFRKAAELLFLTQPAVTLQIKALEEDLGVRLFDRSGGHVTLTKQGAILLRYARKMAAIVSDAEQDLLAEEGQLSGILALGVSTTIAQYVLPRLLAVFLAEHARLQLSLHSGNTDAIVQLLLDDKVSIGLIEGPARQREVRTEPFMEDQLVLIAQPDLEFSRLSREQLLASTLLMREYGSGSRHVVETALEKAGLKLKSFRNVIELDSTQAIKSAVEAGLGVGFVSRWAIHKEIELRALKVVEVEGLRVMRHYLVVSLLGPEPTGAAGAFRSFVLDRAKHLSKSHENTHHPNSPSR
jgi:LysR family transcriptional regulator, transcriptional activator of the cysJI operon